MIRLLWSLLRRYTCRRKAAKLLKKHAAFESEVREERDRVASLRRRIAETQRKLRDA